MPGQLSRLGGSRLTPQNQPASPNQVRNDAGGYVYALTDQQRLMRFLLIGVDEPTYYASAQQLALENTKVVQELIQDESKGLLAVETARDVSQRGRARSNDPALWVLAAASASPHVRVRQAAAAALGDVARTGTHLFTFAGFVKQHRGWGRTLRRAVGDWYSAMPADKLAYQAVKYRQREGWTHRDMLRLSHGYVHSRAAAPAQGLGVHETVLDFICDRPNMEIVNAADELKVIKGFLLAQEAGENLRPRDAVNLIVDYKLPREALPTHVLKDPTVWEALLEHMPMTAMIRNLPTMTNVGLLTDFGASVSLVTSRLSNVEYLRRSRVHPLSVLVALKTYASGHGVRGSQVWTPVQRVVDALDEAFYACYGNVMPTGKAIYLALDVSGSMMSAGYGGGGVFAVAGITPMVMSAAVALVTANVEKNSPLVIRGYNHHMTDVPISPRMRLDQAVEKMGAMWDFGGTNCALPFIDATSRNEKFDAVISYTDSETWAGTKEHGHPMQALELYRQRMGIPTKSVVVGMTANKFTIADPNDANSLDVVGFDANVPELIAEFIR